MHPLSNLPHAYAAPRVPRTEVSDAQRALLNRLRLASMECRAAAHTDLFQACALLTLDGEDAKRTYITTFVKCLPNAVGKRIKWYRPGSDEISFDEAWIIRGITSIQGNDQNSLEFLLKSRIRAADRRYIGFLMARISDQFRQS